MSTAQRQDTEPQIRLAVPSDAEAMAALWSECWPESVWTRLGPRVSAVYFRRYCTGPHELAVTAWLDGQLAGACVGTDRPQAYARALYLEHGGELARALAGQVVLRPVVVAVLLGRLVRALTARLRRAVARGERGSGPPPSPDGACYMSEFFVSARARGRELGTAMLERFCQEMSSRGCTSCLVHTTSENLASQIAQRRAGFECVWRSGSDLVFMRRLAQ